MTELFTLQGSVSGTGTFSLVSDLFRGSASSIRIPKGAKLKIWCKRLAGEAGDVRIQLTRNITAATPTWTDISVERLAASGELTLEKRRPLVVRGITGREAIQVVRTSGSGNMFVDLEVEIE